MCKFLLYVSEKIRPVQMNNLRDLLGIWRIDRIPKAQIRKLCRVVIGVDKRIDESVLR